RPFSLVQSQLLLPCCSQMLVAAAAAVGAFFLSGANPPRQLHSFPTRRSSDLQRRDRKSEQPDLGRPAIRPRVLHAGRRHVPSPQDRKSTRLNSSHSQISYAVFCLKKKSS